VADPLQLQVEPQVIEANMFFAGASARISAEVPQGSMVAVLCTDGRRAIHLKEQGKVWGVLWMSTGEVTYDHVPGLYQLNTSAPLAQLDTPGELERLGLGYAALRATAMDATAAEGPRLFADFLRLKEREGLYATRESSVQVRPRGDRLLAEAHCTIPARAPVGDYIVKLVVFQRGHPPLVSQGHLALRQVRVTQFISRLAQQRGLLYGIFAVVVAIASGLLTGLIFGLKSKKVH
jgi:uncharacterized protein (TIGR02186 family)